PVAEICVEYLERVAEESELDLEAASEFLVLVAALVELESRLLLPDEEMAGDEEVDDATEELATRLAEDARIPAAAEWLGPKRAAPGGRGCPAAPGRRGRRRAPPGGRCRARTRSGWPAPSTGCCSRRRWSTSRTCRSASCRWAASCSASAGCSSSAARSRSTTP